MKDVAPKVAVILTCYNEGKYIGAAVRSVLEQSRADLIESIVIADDGSNWETLATLKQVEAWDPRIRVLYGTGGAGLPSQRNLAIQHTSAPLLAILDGDDIWATRKLELQVAALTADQNVGLVYSSYHAFAWDDLSSAVQARVKDITKESDLTKAYFLTDPPIIPSATLLRRSAFEACGGFDANIRVFEDSDFYLRLSRCCRFAFVAASLLYKRSNIEGITGSRTDLLAHHAFVAFKAASEDPRLLSLIPRRLAERGRKLGNQRLLFGNVREARSLLKFAVRLDPFNVRAWTSLIASTSLAQPACRRLLAANARARRVAMGAAEPCR